MALTQITGTGIGSVDSLTPTTIYLGGSGSANALDDYEEGTWTPTDNSGAGLTFTNADGYYTKVGDLVFAAFRLTYPTTGATNLAGLGGLPFTAGSIADSMYGGTATYHQDSIDMFQFLVGNNNATISIFYGGANQRGVNNFSGKPLRGFVVYKVYPPQPVGVGQVAMRR